jgi:hypothetical protein
MILKEVDGVSFKFGKVVNDNENFPFNWKKKVPFLNCRTGKIT